VRRREQEAMEILEGADQSLLDVIDHVLTKGVLVSGEAMLGVAGVDLIYLRLDALLCAADRVQPRARKK
jgi:Gas vesicle protein